MAEHNLDVFNFTDYRKLLRHFCEREKKRRPEVISYRYLSRKAGFGSPNLIQLIISGQRNLTYQSAQKLSDLMGLSRRKAEFFWHMVRFNQASAGDDKKGAFEKMMSFREYREARKLSQAEYDYFSKWYYPVIRELVNLADFREDPAWIAQQIRPALSSAEAAEALAKLQELKLLGRDRENHLRQNEPNLVTDETLLSTALHDFHSAMIEQGKRSLSQPAAEREISALTMSLSPAQFSALKEKIQEFHKDVQKMIADNGHEPPSRVCQLNFQLFQFTPSRVGTRENDLRRKP